MPAVAVGGSVARMLGVSLLATGVVAVGLLAAVAGRAAGQQADPPGKVVYDRWCASCHGDDGRGDGAAAAYMLPRPRDFTRGVYQIRTTPNGELPTDADLRRIVDDGMPGTAMPGWKSTLTQAERNAVIEYIKGFSRFFAQGPAPEPLSIGRPPRASASDIEEGREVYQRIECWKCHGQAGRGDGDSAPTQADDEGFPIRPADLTEPWRFNGGASVADIYRTLRTGLDGTPMPSFDDLIDSGFITDDELWNLAHYVRSLGPERLPRVREVVRAERHDELPAGPLDEVWNDVDRYYIPLVGQVIARGRWFAPSVDGVWIQAVHDGRELVLRLVWSDPSRSPSPAWADWRVGMLETMEPKETPAPDGDLPDAIAVQFPRTVPSGMERPYFLMGNAREPVYLWRWQSEPESVGEHIARGIDRIEPLTISGAPLTGSAHHEHGQWQIVLRRALVVSDADDGTATDRIDFAPAQAIPFVLFAWDGDNGEAGTRSAISTWYFIYLDQPVAATVFAAPIFAVLLTAGLGFMAVRRAQRRPFARASAAEPAPLSYASTTQEGP
jgi:DMSO reductase family type II enzyme heme b subunit